MPPNVVADDTVRVDMLAVPTTSNDVSGDAVLMPALLLDVSTLNTLVSTVRSLDRDKPDKVLPPVTVSDPVDTVSGLDVMGPMPVVLVGGSTSVVGVMRW